MKAVLTTAAAALFALTMSAQAGQCPSLVQEIDGKLESAQLSDEKKAEVMELRDRGAAQHEAGDHDASVATLQQALGMLEAE